MKTIFKIGVLILILTSCANSELNLDYSNQILDNSIKQTETLISEELNNIEKAFANGIEKDQEGIYKKIRTSSQEVKTLSNSLFKNPSEINKNINKLKGAYSNHIELLLELTNSDARPDNDYLFTAFKSILVNNIGNDYFENQLIDLQKENFIDSVLNTGNSNIDKVNLKLLYNQIQKSELKTYNCLNTYLEGFGLKSHNFESYIKLDNSYEKDSIKFKIITGILPTYSINKYHFGKIDSAVFRNEFKHINYPIGTKRKVPLIGEYKTLIPNNSNEFKIKKGQQIQGVIEIRYSKGLTYIPFKAAHK